MGNNKLLLGTWAAGIILVGYRSFHNGKGMPAPKSLLGVTTIWTILTFFALIPQATKLANVLSVGVIGGLLLTDSSVLGAAPKTAPTVLPTVAGKTITGTNAVPGAPKPGYTP